MLVEEYEKDLADHDVAFKKLQGYIDGVSQCIEESKAAKQQDKDTQKGLRDRTINMLQNAGVPKGLSKVGAQVLLYFDATDAGKVVVLNKMRFWCNDQNDGQLCFSWPAVADMHKASDGGGCTPFFGGDRQGLCWQNS